MPRRYLLDIARSTNDASALVREAWSNYSSPVDYGIGGLDLRRSLPFWTADWSVLRPWSDPIPAAAHPP